MNFLARRLPRTVATARAFSDAAPATAMTLNLSTPHENIYQGKTVDKVLLPGESGEYGVTVGHSPIISQLKPGVVSVIHTEVRTARRFRYFSFDRLMMYPITLTLLSLPQHLLVMLSTVYSTIFLRQ